MGCDYTVRCLALADTHLGFVTGRTAVARRIFQQRMIRQFQLCIHRALEHQVDIVLHAGDIFDRSKPPTWAISAFYSQVQRITDAGIHFIAIPGNHDRSIIQPVLDQYFVYGPYYHLFNKPAVKMVQDLSILGLPYLSYPSRSFQRFTKTLPRNEWHVVLCHQLFAGSWVGPQKKYFLHGENVLSPPRNEQVQVISGHVHRAQSLVQGRVVYPGSTCRTSFAELIEPKGFLLLDIEPDYLKISFEQITTFPMQVIELTLDEISCLDNGSLGIVPEARVLLRVVNSKINPNQLRWLHARFPAHEFPYLRITPTTANKTLTPLYGSFDNPFSFSAISRKIGTQKLLQPL